VAMNESGSARSRAMSKLMTPDVEADDALHCPAGRDDLLECSLHLLSLLRPALHHEADDDHRSSSSVRSGRWRPPVSDGPARSRAPYTEGV
jgi:hypothetical protein